MIPFLIYQVLMVFKVFNKRIKIFIYFIYFNLFGLIMSYLYDKIDDCKLGFSNKSNTFTEHMLLAIFNQKYKIFVVV